MNFDPKVLKPVPRNLRSFSKLSSFQLENRNNEIYSNILHLCSNVHQAYKGEQKSLEISHYTKNKTHVDVNICFKPCIVCCDN